MGGAGWSLKGPQPRLQESLASSFTPFCLTRHSPPPFLLLLPACLPGLPVDPLQAPPPSLLWGAVWISGHYSPVCFSPLPLRKGAGA